MASASRPKGRKRESLNAELERLQGLDFGAEDFDTFFQDLDVAERNELDASTFRHHAPRTQKRQDRILSTYYMWLRLVLRKTDKIHDGMSDEEMDLLAFPSNESPTGTFDTLTKQLRLFLAWVVPKSIPRAMADKVVGYGVMLHYRMALLFWVNRKFADRKEAAPPKHLVWNGLTQVMRKMASETQMKLLRTPKRKTYLGLAEIIQLIDLDTRGTPNIMLAEGHHLAWCIARCCALRPGALGAPEARARDDQVPFPFLRFGDFDVTRRAEPGHFDCTLTIRNLKASSERVAESTGYHTKTVEFRLKTPQSQGNLMMSIIHRFLVLCIRRGALEDYSTLDELLADNRRTIRIKKEFLDRPVILAGTERGLDAVEGKPAAMHALTAYLRRRGQKAGYEVDVTFYSIRRRTATDMMRLLGAEGARAIMCHEPDTRTLEKFYVDTLVTTDVSSLGIGEKPRGEEMHEDSHRLALTKLPPAKVAERYGKQLNALHRQALVTDEEYLACKTDKARKNRERVLRRITLSEFISEAHAEQQATMTVGDFEARKKDILSRATAFNRRLLDNIKKAARTPESSQASQQAANLPESQPDEDDGSTALGDENFEEMEDDDEAAEADIEDRLDEGDGNANSVVAEEEHIHSDAMADYMTLLDDVPYKDAVYASMELLLQNGLNEYAIKVPSQCPTCLDDDTIREDIDKFKFKIHRPDYLPKHMKTVIHSPGQVMLREARNEMMDAGKDEMECRFCAQIVPGPNDKVPSFKKDFRLKEHLVRCKPAKINVAKWSTKKLAQDHWNLMEEFGCFDEDFWGNTEHKKEVQGRARSLNLFKMEADLPEFSYSKEKELVGPVGVPGQPGIMMGSFSSYAGDSIKYGDITTGPVPTSAGLQKLAPPRGVTSGPWPTMETLQIEPHPEDAKSIQVVPMPGTDGGFLGQGNRMKDKILRTREQKK